MLLLKGRCSVGLLMLVDAVIQYIYISSNHNTRSQTNVPTPHENSEYPYEPAYPCNLLWTSLSSECNVRGVPTPHENNDYPYEPVYLRNLIWNSLYAEKKCAERHMRISSILMSLRIHDAWSGLRCLLKKCAATRVMSLHNMHQNSEYPYEPAHSRILEFAVCSNKSAETWDMSLCHMRTVNIHMSLCIRASWSGLCWLLISSTSAQPDLDFAVCWKKSASAWELSLRPMRTANTHISLRIRAAWSGPLSAENSHKKNLFN